MVLALINQIRVERLSCNVECCEVSSQTQVTHTVVILRDTCDLLEKDIEDKAGNVNACRAWRESACAVISHPDRRSASAAVGAGVQNI